MVKRLELHETESVVYSCHHNILLYAGIESLAPPRLHTAMTLQHVTMQANNAYQTIRRTIQATLTMVVTTKVHVHCTCVYIYICTQRCCI